MGRSGDGADPVVTLGADGSAQGGVGDQHTEITQDQS